MTLQSAMAQPGWYPDPGNPSQLRWWDGQRWSVFTTPRPRQTRRSGWVVALVVCAVLLAILVAVGLGLAVVALSDAGSQSAGEPPAGTPAPVSAALSSTVRIEANSCGRGCVYEGSGVAVTPTEILTAEHVVEGVSTVEIFDRHGDSMEGDIVRRDAQLDLAVVQTEPHGLPVAQLLAQNPARGEASWVIGASAWITEPITAGRVLNVTDECANGVLDVVTSADVQSGDSGGPMIDDQGRVMAITKSAPAEGVGGSGTAISEVHSFLSLNQSAFDADGYLTRPEDRNDGTCHYVE